MWRRVLLLLFLGAALAGWAPAVRADGIPPRLKPGVYVAQDQNQTRTPLPAWTAGAARNFGWRELEPNDGNLDFGPIDRWLAGLGAGPEPARHAILGVQFRCPDGPDGTDGCAPPFALTWSPVLVEGKPRLNYLAPEVQWHIERLVLTLGQRYGQDPRLTYVLIEPGFGGELAPCPRLADGSEAPSACAPYHSQYAGQTNAWPRYLQWLLHIYADGFSLGDGAAHVPLQVDVAGKFEGDAERAVLVTTALELGIGLHDPLLAASWLTGEKRDGRCAQDWVPEDPGYREEYAYLDHWLPIERFWGQAPVTLAFNTNPRKSEVALSDEANVWWSVLNALDKHASVLTTDSANLAWPEAYNFFLRYAGRDVRSTPDAWIALRGTSRGWCGDSGDYEWFIHHRAEAAGDSQVVSTASQTGVQTARGWQSAFSRSTDVGNGRPTLYFAVDDGLIFGGEHIVSLDVTYWDGSPEEAGSTWELFYDASKAPNQSAGSVALGGSERWLTHSFMLLDATFRNRLTDSAGQPGNDFRLTATGETDIRFNMLRVRELMGDRPSARRGATRFPTAGAPRLAAATAPNLTPTPEPPGTPAAVTEVPTVAAPTATPTPAPAPVPPPQPAALLTQATGMVIPKDLLFYQPLRHDGTYANDTYLDARQAGANFGRSNILAQRGNGETAALLAFDLSSVPVTSTVQGAWLELNVTSRDKPQPLQGQVFEITREWVDTAATWDVAEQDARWAAAGAAGDGDRARPAIASSTVPASGLWQIPLAGLVQKWIALPAANHGVLLTAQGDAEYYLASSEWRSEGLRPRLRIRLTEGATLPTAPVTPTLAAAGPTRPGPVITATQPITAMTTPQVAARIAEVSLSDAGPAGQRLNLTAYLYPTAAIQAPCDWRPSVMLWGAAGQTPARFLGVGVRETVTREGRSFPAWRFVDIDKSALQGQEDLLHLFVTVDGLRTEHNVVTLGPGHGTNYPEPIPPESEAGIRPALLDSNIEIVWPHDSAAISNSLQANISAALYRSGTHEILFKSLLPLPTVRLHWSVDDGMDRSGAEPQAGQVRQIQTPWLSYYLWDFNNVDVSAARASGHYVNFWLEVAGVPYATNVWSHGSGPRPPLTSVVAPVPVFNCSPAAERTPSAADRVDYRPDATP